MPLRSQAWDYLIVTASNDAQAAAYAEQLEIRRRLKLLGRVRHTLVVADPGGRRVGSGGSTVGCLVEVLRRELTGDALGWSQGWLERLRRLRILIVHAGGDSRRLPAYGPCGKIFVPVPGRSDSALGMTLFDRQLPTYLALPPQGPHVGQVVIASGDVLLGFAPDKVAFAPGGLTGLGCAAAPEHAKNHGVYCAGPGGTVRRFLQKPSPDEQVRQGAIDVYGHAILDIGLFSFDAKTAVRLLELCGAQVVEGRLDLHGPVAAAIEQFGLDFYREICCAVGSESHWETYLEVVRGSGSKWDEALLRQVFDRISSLPCRVQVLKHCDFLHFGTTREIIHSGLQLQRQTEPFAAPRAYVGLNNRVDEKAGITAANAWIEACAVRAELALPGENVVVGVDVDEPLRLPERGCLDVLAGRDRRQQSVQFIRCYYTDDRLANVPPEATTFCGRPLDDWLAAARVDRDAVWEGVPQDRRNGFTARLFPAVADAQGYRAWLWMLDPQAATDDLLRAWIAADRYSFEEMAALTDQEAFHSRRRAMRQAEVGVSLRRLFRGDSGFSAVDLAAALQHSDAPNSLLAAALAEVHNYWPLAASASADEAFLFARALHTVGSAVGQCATQSSPLPQVFSARSAEDTRGRGAGGEGSSRNQSPPSTATSLCAWLDEQGLRLDASTDLTAWSARAREVAFESLRRGIMASGQHAAAPPTSALRTDEIVWGRAPARLDLAGGWTDTPPFALEHGGRVLNAAVLLNTQPPIQAFARVIPRPVIRLRSIDTGAQTEVQTWDELMQFGSASGEFGLPKAALSIAGFAPRQTQRGAPLAEVLQEFGGGLELTTLAAIPKGSGLGTSSIIGAVLLGVLHRVLGRQLSSDGLFHAVLQLEQVMTTGGGWQDQIGGAVGGIKLVTTGPGLVPQTTIRYVPGDVLDPKLNGGQTLLYYTGITRLAKNILQQVVGRWLDRDREAVATLRDIGLLADEMTEAVARKDLPEFGRLIDVAWQLNKRLDPQSTTPELDTLLDRLAPHIFGAKLLGAGGGGFLLMVCRSTAAAQEVRRQLETTPLNSRARFFDFELSPQGLAVSVC